MERRYLTKEIIDGLNFDETLSFQRCDYANEFSEGIKNGIKYLEVDLLFNNENLMKIYFDDKDNYHLNMWNEYRARKNKPIVTLEEACKEVAYEDFFMTTLRCYENREVTITFCNRLTKVLDSEEFRIVGDQIPYLLKVVTSKAKTHGIDFKFNSKYTIYDKSKYIRSYDDFGIKDTPFFNELKKLDVSFDEFTEWLVNKEDFVLYSDIKLVVINDYIFYEDFDNILRECVEHFRDNKIYNKLFKNINTKEEKLEKLERLKKQVELE